MANMEMKVQNSFTFLEANPIVKSSPHRTLEGPIMTYMMILRKMAGQKTSGYCVEVVHGLSCRLSVMIHIKHWL